MEWKTAFIVATDSNGNVYVDNKKSHFNGQIDH